MTVVKFNNEYAGTIEDGYITFDETPNGKAAYKRFADNEKMYFNYRVKGVESENNSFDFKLITDNEYDLVSKNLLWQKLLMIFLSISIWVAIPVFFGWGLWFISWIPAVMTSIYMDTSIQKFIKKILL